VLSLGAPASLEPRLVAAWAAIGISGTRAEDSGGVSHWRVLAAHGTQEGKVQLWPEAEACMGWGWMKLRRCYALLLFLLLLLALALVLVLLLLPHASVEATAGRW